MLSALNVARQLIQIGWSAESPEDSALLTPLRLQKFLYYGQGYYLALLGEPLFREPIEAWANGPVVRAVFERFHGIERGITPAAAGEPDEKLSETEKDFLVMIWQEYSQYPPGKLLAMTRAEPAWKEARADVPADGESSGPLSLETLKAFFTDQMWEKARKATPAGYPVANPAEAWQAERELVDHPERGRRLEDVMQSLKSRRTPA